MTRIEELSELENELAVVPGSLSGIRKRCLRRVRRRRSIILMPLVAITVLAASFITLSNTSVVFAKTVGEIPYLQDLAAAVTFDPGLHAAVENKYVQIVNLSQKKNGVTLSIPYIIADKQRMVVFFRVTGLPSRNTNLNTDIHLKFLDTKTRVQLPYSYSVNGVKNGVLQDVTVTSSEGDLISAVTMEISLVEVSSKSGNDFISPDIKTKTLADFSLATILNPPAESQIYHVNQNVCVNGQTLVISSVEVTPLNTKVTVLEGNTNTAKLTAIRMSLHDKRGRVWGSGALSSFGNTYYLYSTYYSGAEKLTLDVDSVSFLPDSKKTVKVDLKSKTASPLTDGIKLVSVNWDGNSADLSFTSKQNGIAYAIFNSGYTDASGASYSFNYMTESCEAGDTSDVTENFRVTHTEGGVVYLEREYAPPVKPEKPIRIELK